MIDSLDEQKSIRLRQRLWGAAVLIALLVIFLPLVLDGSGSESQYRRVESLRAEPPRVLDAQGVPEPVEMITQIEETTLNQQSASESSASEPVQVAEIKQPSPPSESLSNDSPEKLTAWVVQAGSFGDEANAIAVRDKLRRAGYPSFVTPTDTTNTMYRVRVGPMINLQQAEASRNKVMRLLEREAIVVRYP